MNCDERRKEVWVGNSVVLANEQVAEGVRKIALEAPELAERAKPGQFLMLRALDCVDPLLGRPFAIYDADRASGRVEALYAIVGKATTRASRVRPGESLGLWGPLGNGWSASEGAAKPKRLILVAGGVGCAPFYLLLKELASRAPSERPETTYLCGARSSSKLLCFDEFERLGIDARAITEDGGRGVKGVVTDLLPELFATEESRAATRILACGPYPMLRAVAKWANERSIECWTSMESPMACGLGICFSCVVKYRDDDGTIDYKRTCVDGPVFDASRLVWE